MKCINNNFEQDLEMSTSSISIASRSVRELVHPGVTGSLNSVDSVMKTVKDVAKMVRLLLVNFSIQASWIGHRGSWVVR